MARMSAEERRHALVEAAIEVMKRRGVANTSTRDIVAEAGMQIGVFHYCFESKEHLVREVMARITERSYTAVGGALGEVEPGAAMVHAAVMAYWHHIQDDPNEHLLTYELTTHALRNLRADGDDDWAGDVVARARKGDQVPDAAQAQYRHYLTSMEGLLGTMAEACETSFRTPLPAIARLTLAAIEGITLQWLVDADDDAAQASLRVLADVLVWDAGLT